MSTDRFVRNYIGGGESECQSFLVTALAAGLVLTIVLLVITWRQRPVPGATPFALMLFGSILWIGTEIGKFYTTAGGAFIFEQLRWVGSALIPLAWLVFALEYTGNEKYIRLG